MACAWGWAPRARSRSSSVRAAGLRSLEIFKAAGVKMALGTDLLGGSHGLQSEELLIRAQVQSNLEVLQSATLIGAELLGQAGRLGEVSVPARAPTCCWSTATRCRTCTAWPARASTSRW
jgi:imidazolonepropionase-like amidohydrolase